MGKARNIADAEERFVARWNAFEGPDGRDIGNGQVIFTPDMDGPNFIKQTYANLKTLPEFESAVDC